MKQIIGASSEPPPVEMRSARLGPMPIVVVCTEDGELTFAGEVPAYGRAAVEGQAAPRHQRDTCGHYEEEIGRFIVKSPWHGYEYDLRSGATLFDERQKLWSFAVGEENGQIVALR
jgi:nitrite reductase/ring-hydroxylating ferredoxin subunit